MGAIATFLIGLGLLGMTITIQDDLNNIIKIFVGLLSVIFLAPLTLHQLEPDTYAENMLWWTFGAFVPVVGLLTIPAAVEGLNVPGLAGELLGYTGILLQGVVIFAIAMIAWKAIQTWRTRSNE